MLLSETDLLGTELWMIVAITARLKVRKIE